MTTWDSTQYLRFEAERTRPCRDLALRVALTSPRRVVDLGCGPGNSTAVLAERWPDAELLGIDSAPDMLARARRDHPRFQFEEGDIATFRAAEPFDLIFSNAALQWVPDHGALLPHLLDQVAPGGALAVQMPGNHDAPPHRLMRELAASPAWRESFAEPAREWFTSELPAYYDILSRHAKRLDLWVTEYLHVLDDVAAIAEWYRGTGLRPFLDRLPEERQRAKFLAEYTALLGEVFAPQADGRVLFPFRRVFLIAYR